MLFKYLVVAVLFAIVLSMGSGLYYLMTDKKASKGLLRSLTLRIGLSVSLFIMLFIAWRFGLVTPHPLEPTAAPTMAEPLAPAE